MNDAAVLSMLRSEPAFALWLVPHITALVLPPLLAVVYLQRGRLALWQVLFFAVGANVLFWFISPLAELLATPEGTVLAIQTCCERFFLSSLIVLIASASVTWFLVMLYKLETIP